MNRNDLLMPLLLILLVFSSCEEVKERDFSTDKLQSKRKTYGVPLIVSESHNNFNNDEICQYEGKEIYYSQSEGAPCYERDRVILNEFRDSIIYLESEIFWCDDSISYQKIAVSKNVVFVLEVIDVEQYISLKPKCN